MARKRGHNKSSNNSEVSHYHDNTYWVKLDNGEWIHVSASEHGARTFMHAGPAASKLYKEKTGETLGFCDTMPGEHGCDDILTFPKG
jgi:hypothetical protein